jgi:N-acetylglucosamine malate deacetylase 2
VNPRVSLSVVPSFGNATSSGMMVLMSNGLSPEEHCTPHRILYVFPHPDDESFGPALAISSQRLRGDEVHLLTLTRGGATRIRHDLGLSIEQMGEVRAREMDCVRQVLDLSGFTLLDLPDGDLEDLDPIGLEAEIERVVAAVRPHVLVTYAVHGVSGFHDHLVTHAVVKRVFCQLARDGRVQELRRLALFTLLPSEEPDTLFPLKSSKPEDVGVMIPVRAEDLQRGRKALACYETYATVIEQARPLERVGSHVPFELFGESFDTPLASLTERLPER